MRLESDTGIVGWGETCPLGSTYLEAFGGGARAALAELAPVLTGLDPTNLGAIGDAMDSALRGHAYAKAAIDIACWDLLGHALNVPVSTLLGGVRSADFPLYVAIPLGPIDDDGRPRPRPPRGGHPPLPAQARRRPARGRRPRARRARARTSTCSPPTPTAAGACRTR